jgi:hypothetical protein
MLALRSRQRGRDYLGSPAGIHILCQRALCLMSGQEVKGTNKSCRRNTVLCQRALYQETQSCASVRWRNTVLCQRALYLM